MKASPLLVKLKLPKVKITPDVPHKAQNRLHASFCPILSDSSIRRLPESMENN